MLLFSATNSLKAQLGRLPPPSHHEHCHHRSILSLLVELNRLGTAVVIATHDIALMDRYNARRMILSEGRLDIHD